MTTAPLYAPLRGKLDRKPCAECGGPKLFERACVPCKQGHPMTCPACDGVFRAGRGFGCYCSEACARRFDPFGVTLAAEAMRAYRRHETKRAS